MIRSLLDAGFRVGASRALQGRARAMTASSESNSSSTTSAAAEATAQLTLWGRICRWATWGTFGTIVLFAISQPFLRMWDSPFGPIRFDIGFKLNRQPGEGLTAWFISFGQAF